MMSGKGVHMYKGLGVRFADFIYFCFIKYLIIMKHISLTETKLFHVHRIFKNVRRGRGGGSLEPSPDRTPSGPATHMVTYQLSWTSLPYYLNGLRVFSLVFCPIQEATTLNQTGRMSEQNSFNECISFLLFSYDVCCLSTY